MQKRRNRYDTLIEAFAQHRKYFSYFTGLEALAKNNPGLQKTVSDLLSETHTLATDEIHENLMVEYRGLDASSIDGDVFSNKEERSPSTLE